VITNWDLIKGQLSLAYFRKGLIKKQEEKEKALNVTHNKRLSLAAQSPPAITCGSSNT